MPDIRLVRPRGSYVWLLVGGLIAASLSVLLVTWFAGDPTEAARTNQVGARANFGSERAPVIPVAPTPFEAVSELSEDDLGRLVHLTAVAESRLAGNSVWVRSAGGRRILVRFEPPPPEGTRLPIYPGAGVSLDGYIQKIARAELKVRLDSLGVASPAPPRAWAASSATSRTAASCASTRSSSRTSTSRCARRRSRASPARRPRRRPARGRGGKGMRWRPQDLDRLERAIDEGARVQLARRGTEYVIQPRELRIEGATEVILAGTPTPGWR